MTTRLVLLGGGGHAGTVRNIIARVDAATPTFEVLGVLDDGRPQAASLAPWGLAHLGPISALATLDVDAWFPTVGLPESRRAVCTAAGDALPAARVIAPDSVLAAGVELGGGTLVAHGCVVAAGTVSGEHAILGTASVIGVRVRLDTFASVLSAAVLGDGVEVGEGALIGSGACIAPGVTIGPWARVGAGAVVTRDVPPGATVIGNPARMLGGAGGAAS